MGFQSSIDSLLILSVVSFENRKPVFPTMDAAEHCRLEGSAQALLLSFSVLFFWGVCVCAKRKDTKRISVRERK